MSCYVRFLHVVVCYCMLCCVIVCTGALWYGMVWHVWNNIERHGTLFPCCHLPPSLSCFTLHRFPKASERSGVHYDWARAHTAPNIVLHKQRTTTKQLNIGNEGISCGQTSSVATFLIPLGTAPSRPFFGTDHGRVVAVCLACFGMKGLSSL